ncbi:MAG: replication-associated recombination protein A [Candidatus Omnitrophica bacterium]|nr:replication-associated recombination protein A [Candidatus Omnitrophota bacterium]
MEKNSEPLAIRMRPKDLSDFIGQDHVLGEGKLLKRALDSKKIVSLILWGPAGCGKTSLGAIVAKELNAEFQYLNAAFSSVSEVKKVIAQAHIRLNKENKKTAIFIDEVHRFNKLQQEALVPDTENGTIIFIGATIYIPHYYIIPSLISRSIMAHFNPLTKEDLMILLKRAVTNKEKGLGHLNLKITNKALEHLAILSSGDARKALMSLEIGALSITVDSLGDRLFDLDVAKASIQKNLFYDKADSYHYDTISAFIKSVRGSDVDSALYWLARMIKSGEDPRFIARRLIILSSEDVGNADPFGLVLATNCFKAVECVGYPEAQLILAQTTIYLACSPKSNAAYKAISKAISDVETQDSIEVPEHIKTNSKKYVYPHDFQKSGIGGYVKQDYGINKKYYFPHDCGQEARLKEFIDRLNEIQ